MKRFSSAASAILVLAAASSASAYEFIDRCAPVWDELPSPYYVNEDGYSEIPLETVRGIFVDGFDAWAAPCCSSFTADEQGLTSGVAENGSDERNIISFRESSWPSELGDPRSVLAVTLPQYYSGRSGCVMAAADMVFNAANQTFGTRGTFSVVDLLSVTTHEQGHWLGLDHSPIADATMYYSYIGEGGRSLHSDDIDGVCALYPGECSCETDADCEDGEVCNGGGCVEAPCESDADCDAGLTCDAGGDCVTPPCETDADCVGSEVCQGGNCITNSDCPICADCDSNDDCGGANYVCAGDGAGTNLCTRLCDSAEDCPGDSACFEIPGQGFNICLNPDAAEVGPCPSDYVCAGSDSPADLCDGVTCGAGEVCDSTTGDCVDQGGGGGDCIICDPCEDTTDCPGGDCYSFGAGGVCTQNCGSSADCPAGTECFDVEMQGGGSIGVCLNDDAATGGVCPGDFVCEDTAPVDLCEDVTCGADEYCDADTGDCVERGGGDTADPDCPVCFACDTDADCSGATCLPINGGVCAVDCETSDDCPGNTQCFEIPDGANTISACLNEDAATAGVCPGSFTCVPTTDDGGDGGGDGGDGNIIDEGSDDSSSGSTTLECSATNAPAAPFGLLLIAGAAILSRRRRAA